MVNTSESSSTFSIALAEASAENVFRTSAKSGLEGFLTLYGKHTSLKDMVEVKRNNLVSIISLLSDNQLSWTDCTAQIWSGRLSPPETAPLTLTWTCYNPGVASKKTPALDRTVRWH